MNSTNTIRCLLLMVLTVGTFITITTTQTFAQSQTRRIVVQSQQDSVAVYADTVFQGFVPIQLNITCDRPTSLSFSKEGFRTRKDTLTPHDCIDTVLLVHLQRPATIAISSEPEAASVYINRKFAGTCPLTLSDVGSDTLQITVSKPLYYSWFTTLVPRAGETTELTAKLERRRATISVLTNSPGITVSLDNRVLPRDSVTDHAIASGLHKLFARHDSTGREIEAQFTAKDGQKLIYRADFGAHSTTRTALAMLLPGSAQLLDKSYAEGSLMFVGSIALGVNAVIAHSDYRDRVDQYDLAWSNYINAPTETEAARLHEDVENRKNDLDKAYARRAVSAALFVAGYVYSVIDALLHHTVVDRFEVVPVNTLISDRGMARSHLAMGIEVKIGLP